MPSRYPFIGNPILFENMLIRKMLELADIRKDDVFYDLGCGHGQNLIMASEDYGVKDCVGIESKPMRYREALRRIEKKHLSKRITVVKESFEYVDLEDADVVFYGLTPDHDIIDKFVNNLKKGCRLVFYFNALLPAIKPIKIDYPFYMAEAPIKEAKSEIEWLSSVIPIKYKTAGEYWNEFNPKNSGKAIGFFGVDGNYLRTLRAFLKKRLKKNRQRRGSAKSP